MKKLSIIILFAFISSCTKIVDIDVPVYSEKPVAYSLFAKDSTFKIQLTKAVDIFDAYQEPVTEAEVLLYEDDFLVDSLICHDEIFESDVIAGIDKTYKITAKIDGFETVYASDYIPDSPVLGGCVIVDNSIVLDEEEVLNQEAQITIQDNNPEENFYELILLKRYISDYTNEEVIANSYCYSESPVIVEEGQLPVYPETLVFSDKLFNNSEVTLSIFYEAPHSTNYGDGSNITYLDYSLIVVLRSITPDYYNYTNTLYQHIYNQDTDVWNPVSEPVQMYSNIQNGLGIFAGYSEIRLEVVSD